MKITSLSSGSSGNCYLVQSEQGQSVLIDCGLSASKIKQYLAAKGVAIAELSAIFLTHDHGDHLRGAGTISQRWGVPVYANARTLEAAQSHWNKLARLELQREAMFAENPLAQSPLATVSEKPTTRKPIVRRPASVQPLETKYNLQILPTGGVAYFGGLQISSFPVSHDAADTVCYTIKEGERQATILTDLGCATPPIFEPLIHSDLIIMEANHRLEQLKASSYPYSLKARILGDRGHLSNLQSGEILLKVIQRSSPAHSVWLAHLSQETNSPQVARHEINSLLEMHDIRDFQLQIALRDKPSLQWQGDTACFQLSMF